jgi:hypothetical protein
MKVATLKGGVRRIYVEIPPEAPEGEIEQVWVDYRPGELTLEINDKIKEAVAFGFEADVAEIMLNPLLEDWDVEEDVTDEAGEPTGEVIHLSPKNGGIKKVPLSFLGLVLQAIQEDAVPNAPRGGTSDGISPQEVNSVAALTGTGTSEQPTGLAAAPGSS